MRIRKQGRKSRRLQLETLEARKLLTVFTPLPALDDGAAGSLRAAVLESQQNGSDDVIQLSAGIYKLDLGDLLVDEPQTLLQIVGAGQSQTVIELSDSRAFDIDFEAALKLSDVTIFGGQAEEGGQIRSAGWLSAERVNLTGGQAVQGGALFNGGKATLNEVQINGNEAVYGGAVWNHAGASLRVEQALISANRSTMAWSDKVATSDLGIAGLPSTASGFEVVAASGIFNGGDATLTNSEIVSNYAEQGYALLNLGDAAKLTLNEVVVHSNSVFDLGPASQGNVVGGAVRGIGGQIVATDSKFYDDTSKAGQPTTSIFVSEGRLDIERVLVENGIRLTQADARLENITLLGGLRLVENAGQVVSLKDSVVDLFNMYGGRSQVHSQGGNVVGRDGTRVLAELNGQSQPPIFNVPTDWVGIDSVAELREGARLFEDQVGLLPLGVYEGTIAMPPSPDSLLLGRGELGSDSGAFQASGHLLTAAPLPPNREPDAAVHEDTESLLQILADDVTYAKAARGTLFHDADGWHYRSEQDYVGYDSILVRTNNGNLHLLMVDVLSTIDPPIASDYTATALGYSEVWITQSGIPDWIDEKLVEVNREHAVVEKRQYTETPTAGPDFGAGLISRSDYLQQFGDDGYVESQIPPGFSGTLEQTTRFYNSSGGYVDVRGTTHVLDPESTPAIGFAHAQFVNENNQPITAARAGDEFYLELRFEDIRASDHPVNNASSPGSPGFASIESIVDLSGVSLREGVSGQQGEMLVSNITVDSLVADGLRIQISSFTIGALDNATFRIPLVANEAGVLNADFVLAAGRIENANVSVVNNDWFERNTASLAIGGTIPEDVNADSIVSPLDALLIINRINASAEGESKTTDLRLDVNRDGITSPLDVLLVYNYLNARNDSSTTVPEGEQAAADALDYGLAAPPVEPFHTPWEVKKASGTNIAPQ